MDNERVIRALKSFSDPIRRNEDGSFPELPEGLRIWTIRQGQDPYVNLIDEDSADWLKGEGEYFTAIDTLIERAEDLTMPVELLFEEIDAEDRAECGLPPAEGVGPYKPRRRQPQEAASG